MKNLLSSLSIACLSFLILVGCNNDVQNIGGDSNGKDDKQIEKEMTSMDSFKASIIKKDDTSITVSSTDNDENIEQFYRLGTSRIDHTAEVGDKVIVWTTGRYEDSRIRQGVATKIVVVE
ncbi:hypothetical protein [Paenibacillus faecalis]|uniref:hypothetical protein n=1 Tax=Paenibacillus faecalis TaxID=2079532 RepID=UPI000D0F003F|nr:hypothetical protein [Paenibacillus faecalis]